jgi:hypothetical protein
VTYLSEACTEIRHLHERAVAKAYELGRWAHSEGQPEAANPLDICDSLDKAWLDGWLDEKAGKP